MLSGGLLAAREDSGMESATNRLAGLNLGYSYLVSDALRVSLGANYMDTRYQGLEAAFTEIRRDRTGAPERGRDVSGGNAGCGRATLSESYGQQQ